MVARFKKRGIWNWRKKLTLLRRKVNEDVLDIIVESWTAEHSARDVMDHMQAAGVAAGMVNTTRDTFEDLQLKDRKFYVEVDHSELGKITISDVNSQCILSKVARNLRRASPCLGEHTEHFYTQILGMSDEEFVSLFAEGVFD